MSNVCANHWCCSPFEVTPQERAFLQKMHFTFGNTTVHPAEPVYCPTCRLQIRTCHRNERFLHRTRSALSGKETISLYADTPPWGAPYKVYAQDEWRSDRWDPMEEGRAFDFTKSFFEQFAELHKAVPRMALITVSNENCDYTTGTGYCKNCYLINSSEYCQDCSYGKLLQSCKSSLDCHYLFDAELCYECFSAYNCYHCIHLSFSKNCQDCHFSCNLLGCKNCCFCTNLSHKEYHWENAPLPKEEYQRRLTTLFGSHISQGEAKRNLTNLRAKSIWRATNIVNSEACTGDYIENSKNCLDCYDMTDSQDCQYVTVGVNVKDNVDCSNMYLKPELCYETLGTIEVYNCAYCLFVFHSQNLLYCEYCFQCSDCFGCSGLTRKKHCICDRQYTKEEYEALVPKIIEHMQKTQEWGLYFPPTITPFSYHETLASEYVPLRKDEAVKRGFLWREVKDEIPKVEKIIPAGLLPERIEDIPDDVLNWALQCEISRRPYVIQRPELAFYRKMQLPLPRKHPDVRYEERMRLRNPRKLWKRTCAKCQQEIQTTFAPDRPEMIYCDSCYLQVVY